MIGAYTPSAFCGQRMSTQLLTTRLAEAKEARHKIATSQLSSYQTVNGDMYTKQSLRQLTEYIRELERELAGLAEPGTGFGFHLTTFEGAR